MSKRVLVVITLFFLTGFYPLSFALCGEVKNSSSKNIAIHIQKVGGDIIHYEHNYSIIAKKGPIFKPGESTGKLCFDPREPLASAPWGIAPYMTLGISIIHCPFGQKSVGVGIGPACRYVPLGTIKLQGVINLAFQWGVKAESHLNPSKAKGKLTINKHTFQLFEILEVHPPK